MSLLDWIGIGKEVAEPIKAVGDLYTTDKARLEAEKQLEEVVQKPQLAQLATNSVLASSPFWFNSGWQPLLGWTAGFLVLLFYGPQILIATIMWTWLSIEQHKVLVFPMKPDDILNLIWLLFGFGAHSLIKKKLD